MAERGAEEEEGVREGSTEHAEPDVEESDVWLTRGSGLQTEETECTKKQGIKGWRELGTTH